MAINKKNRFIPKDMTLEMCAFESRQAMVKAMSDPLYGKDQEYTELVQHMATRPFGEDLKANGAATWQLDTTTPMMSPAKAEAKTLEAAAIFKERTARMFGDPRYPKSPEYRKEVSDWIEANTPEIEASPGFALRDVNQTRGAFRVELGRTEDLGAQIRADRKAQEIQAEKERIAEQHKRIDEGLPADLKDLGGRKL